jgi:hypothetical protein
MLIPIPAPGQSWLHYSCAAQARATAREEKCGKYWYQTGQGRLHRDAASDTLDSTWNIADRAVDKAHPGCQGFAVCENANQRG